MTKKMMFNYILKPVKDCAFPITESGKKNIAWFWLTDSCYYIQLGDVRLFEHSQEQQAVSSCEYPYVEYPYIRQLEDLFDILTQLSSGITENAFRLISTKGKCEWLRREVKQWYELLGDDITEEQDDLYCDLLQFLNYGCLDSGYLRFKSGVFFYHIGEKMIIRYDFKDRDEDGLNVWSATAGEFEMTWTEFVKEIENLLHSFFSDMDKQVEDAICNFMNDDYYKSHCVRDIKTGRKVNSIDYLRIEHGERRDYFYNILENVKKGIYQPDMDFDKAISRIEFVHRELLSKILDKPRICVDFNEMIGDNMILLSKEDTKTDSSGNIVSFSEGMPIGIYSDDNLDENDQIDCIIADGIAVRTPPEWKCYSHVKWCCKVIGKYSYMSDDGI